MGAQIGCEYAMGGHEVALLSRDPEALKRRVDDVFLMLRDLELCEEQAALDATRRLRFANNVSDAAANCDVVVESLPEDLELKARILGEAARAAENALLASNTSSLRISDLGRAAGAPERTIGLHYWNPPLLMPLVEVVAGEGTDASWVEFACELMKGLGKKPMVVQRDIPGFVWNRLQFAIIREATYLVQDGVISSEGLDQIVTEGLARRWHQVGPLRSMALGGLSTWNAAARQIVPSLSRAQSLPDLSDVAIHGGSPADDVRKRDQGLASELPSSER
jgi:3-hydroxybutyryl-CoA dehydrogenase